MNELITHMAIPITIIGVIIIFGLASRSFEKSRKEAKEYDNEFKLKNDLTNEANETYRFLLKHPVLSRKIDIKSIEDMIECNFDKITKNENTMLYKSKYSHFKKEIAKQEYRISSYDSVIRKYLDEIHKKDSDLYYKLYASYIDFRCDLK